MEVMLRTPRRMKQRPPSGGERRHSAPERRKSLFGLSGISPLSSPEQQRHEGLHPASPSSVWSDDTPKKSKPPPTPVKSLESDFTQMALDKENEECGGTPPREACVIAACTPPTSSRLATVGSGAGRRGSPARLVAGVRRLSPDRGLITPETFYGRQAVRMFATDGPHTDGRELYRRIRDSVRVRLPMETFPKEKKRARSSSGGLPSVKRHASSTSPRTGPQKPKASTKKRKLFDNFTAEDLEKELAMAYKSHKTEQETHKKTESKKSKTEKQVYNWQFFNTKTPPSSKVLKLRHSNSPSVLTPPPTSRKRKLLCTYDLDHLQETDENSSLAANTQAPAGKTYPMSPAKARKELGGPEKKNITRKSLVSEILDDFSEEENEEDVYALPMDVTVQQLLDNLNGEVAEVVGKEAVNEEIMNAEEETQKLFPIFTQRNSTHEESSSPASQKLPMKRLKPDMNQLLLDVGQKDLREVECAECGLLYVKGESADELAHFKHHLSATSLKINVLKNARYVRIMSSGEKVILVKDGDSKAWWDRAKYVLAAVDAELGYPAEDAAPPTQVYLYMKKNLVVGCLAARPLKEAHRRLPSLGLDTDLCSEEKYPCKVGISRLWVSSGHRRKGVASCLMNCLMRNCIMFGEILKPEDIAFSSPTEDGSKFAESFFKREDYLIYTFGPCY